MVKESGIVGAGLEAEGLEALGHGDGVEVALRLDDKSEAPGAVGGGAAQAEALPELGELALDLGGGEVGGHGTHALADPTDHAPSQLPAPQGVPVLVERADADGRLLHGGQAFFPFPFSRLLPRDHHLLLFILRFPVLPLLFLAAAQHESFRR